MKKIITRFVLSGKANQSYHAEVNEDGTVTKKNPISNCRVLLCDEGGCRQFPETIDDKIVINCGADDTNSVFEGTQEDGKILFKPFHGLVVLFCVEKKKNGNKYHFLWRNILNSKFQYAKFSCFGFEEGFAFKICDFLFSNLKELLALPAMKGLALNTEKTELESEPVLILEE